MKKNGIPGNTLGEYGLVGALVLVSCLGGVALLGSSLEQVLDGFNQSLSVRPKVSSAESAQGNSPVHSIPPSAQGVMQNPSGASPVGMTAATGSSKLMLNNLTVENTAKTIQVVGANGTTRELMKLLESRIQTMLAAGEITQEEANLLQELANKGHYLANVEKSLEDAFMTGKTEIVFEGQSYLTEGFGHILGFNRALSVEERWEMDPKYANPALKPFAEVFAKVKQSPMFANPSVKQQVFEITMQIAALDEALASTTVNVLDTYQASPSKWSTYKSELDQGIAENFVEMMAGAPYSTSTQNHDNSGKICSTGNGKDSGTACSR
jgi:hypothetical protein